ncbi:electron transporter [Streptomyces sp. CB03234]|uniref:DM13 domain-containing protein n=1 Tax=Streptomyces sp. (strain CB03234) TaxID=1703937 RepID=UPI00093ADAF8|nr:DM13 domain-containing protein [Streptomyces sp. CB03234]OKK04596.1 electron transporter [Streptomyces sp. CB03234]
MTSKVVIGALVLVLVAVGFGLYWFQPWKLWADQTVSEAVPPAAPSTTSTALTDPSGDPSTAPSEPAAPAGPQTLATGTLISHEHSTTGTVRVVKLADGSRILRIENLDTSNGPDLKVWVTDAPVREGKAGWHVFDDGAYLSLGDLKGNKGDQNYALPAEFDPKKYTSVSIWCDRFDVSFGAATLKAV